MIINPTKEFASVTISCFDVSLEILWEELELAFVEHRMNVSCEKRQLVLEAFGPNPRRGGLGPSMGGLFTPGLVNTPATAMITNLMDGWQTLATTASTRLGCSCWRFTVCRNEEFPRTAFTWIQGGRIKRTVSVQLDTRWEFVAKGEVLSIENEAVYKLRRIRDRVTSEYILSIAEKAGFPIGDDAFWQTDESGILFKTGARPSFR